jgi:mono/diheme cytochrome c family protein
MDMPRLPLIPALIGLAITASAATAAENASSPNSALTRRGAALAELWCNACHITGAGQSEDPMTQSPSFSGLSARAAGDEALFRRTLSRPHYPMRAITLSPGEIDAIFAYIRSLEAGNTDRSQ